MTQLNLLFISGVRNFPLWHLVGAKIDEYHAVSPTHSAKRRLSRFVQRVREIEGVMIEEIFSNLTFPTDLVQTLLALRHLERCTFVPTAKQRKPSIRMGKR